MKFLKKTVRLVSGFLEAMRDDHVGAYAAQTAYFIMLSFFISNSIWQISSFSC